VCESPPKSGKYFYDNAGDVTEPLFSAMMKLIEDTPTNKENGLREFQNRGYMLVDAVYTPINDRKDDLRGVEILRWYQILNEDLTKLTENTNAPLILIKATVCVLEQKLRKGGFAVLNNNIIIPFPSTGQQPNFFTKMSEVLKKANIQL